MTLNEFLEVQEKGYVSDRNTIATIMEALPKAEVLDLIPKTERKYKLGSNGDEALLKSLELDVLDPDEKRPALGDIAAQVKAKFPGYARSFFGTQPNTICKCISELAYEYGVALKKKGLI